MLATHLYAEDYNGYCSPYYDYVGWYAVPDFEPYLNMKKNTRYNPTKRPQTWCPTSPPSSLSAAGTTNASNFGYGANFWGWGASEDWQTRIGNKFFVHLQMAPKATEYAYLLDSVFYDHGARGEQSLLATPRSGIWGSLPSPRTGAFARHNNSINVVMADTHVESHDPTNFVNEMEFDYAINEDFNLVP